MAGDKLASGAKSANFSTSDKSMTKEQWDAMFEPEYEDVAETDPRRVPKEGPTSEPGKS